jgi:hypothetical protein
MNADRLSAALAGRYRIERELGAGGMATVYRAEDLKHGRKVAIKEAVCMAFCCCYYGRPPFVSRPPLCGGRRRWNDRTSFSS